MKKCTIIGKFALNENVTDGQTVKCQTIYNELLEKYGKDSIDYLDSYGWQNKKTKTLISCIKAIKNSENIIMLPAHNGVKVFGPLLSIFNKLYKRKLHYIVIGSWLFQKVENNIFLKKSLLSFNAIYVETTLLKKKLEGIGFNNIYKMNNYKKINPIKEKDFKKFEEKKVLNTCIFSRINAEKGIEDAIKIVGDINKEKVKFTIDIYGQVDETFKSRFEKLLEDNNFFVKYKGIVKPQESVSTIRNYDLLLFPTKYYTEGIPGTIIDAFAAGVPVLASKWENYKDIVSDEKDGLIFDFNNNDDFKNKLNNIYNNQKKVYGMKKNCLEKSENFCSKQALNALINRIERD